MLRTPATTKWPGHPRGARPIGAGAREEPANLAVADGEPALAELGGDPVAVPVGVTLSGGAIGSTWPILDAGGTATFTAGGTKLAQPLDAGASLSPVVLGYQLTGLTLRLPPGSDVFTKAGS